MTASSERFGDKRMLVLSDLYKNKIQFEDRNKPINPDWPKYGS